MTRRVSIIGHFGQGKNFLDGQTIKTKIVTEELENRLGHEQLFKIDTHGGWKTFFKAPLQVFSALKNGKNVIMFPAQNGLRVYAPLLRLFRTFFRNRKLHYIVIGGWLSSFISKRKSLLNVLKSFDAIYVETKTMKTDLEKQGLLNIHLMPNCKKLTVISEEELVYPNGAPYKLCTFSRVMKEKGIEDAVNAIIKVNEKAGYQAFSLDIYGQVDLGQVEWFDEFVKRMPDCAKYKGFVESDKSVETLKQYLALLFPTRFYTEGVPGTIIDAYAAGVPVISAKWESFADVVEDGITGIGYKFNNTSELENLLLSIVKDPCIITNMKVNALKKTGEFTPTFVIDTVVAELE